MSAADTPRVRAADRIAAVAPALLLLVAAVALSIADGAVAPATSYPAGLGVLALAGLVAVLAPPRRSERSPWWDLAVLAFGVWTAWQFLSILWADSRGDAWDGANRSLIYLLALWIVGVRPFMGVALRAAVGIAAAAGTLVAVGVLLHVALIDDASSAFLEGRLALPVRYANATADLFLITCFCALGVALSRDLPLPVRALGMAAATLCLETALLSQSRGAVLGFVVAALVLLVASRRRLVTLAALVVPLACTAAGFSAITDVRNATSAAALDAEFDAALRAIGAGALVAAVVAAAAILVARRAPGSLRGARAERGGDLAVAGLAVVVVVGGLVAIGNPGTWLQDRWDDFKTSGYTQVDAGSNRFGGSIGSSRYDFWRVALNQFTDHPILGAGADNYAADYLQQRRAAEAPRHPHGLPFKLLGQTGLVGTLAFVAFLALALASAARALRRLEGGDRALAAAALAGFAAWFGHGLVDWLYEFPALSLFALALLAVCARAEPEPVGAPSRRDPFVASPVRVPALTVGAIVLALSLAAPGAAARFTDDAVQDFAVAPRRTLDRLDRAQGFNPLSSAAPLARGVLAQRLGDLATARSALETAVDRDERNWFAHLELALVASQQDDREGALAEARRAMALNPRQPVIAEVVDAIAGEKRLDPAEVEAKLSRQLQGRLRSVEQG